MRAAHAEADQYLLAFGDHVLDRQLQVGDARQQRVRKPLDALGSDDLERQAGIVPAKIAGDMAAPPGFVGSQEGFEVVAGQLLVRVGFRHLSPLGRIAG